MENIGCFLFIIFLLHSTLISAQEVEDERDFDYLEKSGKGPQHWGELKEEWAICKHGVMQSPIDLSRGHVQWNFKLEDQNVNYKPSKATIKNRGHDIAVNWLGDPGTIQINGIHYGLKQCHWHSPAEHTINGTRYALESHLVHTSVENKILVVGLFYKTGTPDAFLSKLTKSMKSIAHKKQETPTKVIDPREIGVSGSNYYSYLGSLTVPPCTEDVIWIINEQVMTVSTEQVTLLRDVVHDYAKENARPIQ